MIQKFTVVPRIPERLRPLQVLARNLWWSWNRNSIALFRRIDVAAWESSGHNPVALLGSLNPRRLAALEEDDAFLAHMSSVYEEFREYVSRPTWFARVHGAKKRVDVKVAYFSAEFGIHECLPLYSGGLGALAGDHVKSAADLGVPLVGVGLAYQQGYYRQYLNTDGWQQERYPDSDFYSMPLTLIRDADGLEITVEVSLLGRTVVARVWRLEVGRSILYLLDANVPANEPGDREITARLYGGDLDMRIRQEILLGIGGVRAVAKLGYEPTVCHMNEGHSAFLAVERIRVTMAQHGLSFAEAKEAVKASNVFTTHTPVPAGNDRFPGDMVREYFRDYVRTLGISLDAFVGLGRENPDDPREEFCMTVLALRLASRYNGVSRLHGEISRRMWVRVWPGVPEREIPIGHVTNGVHTPSWLAEDFARLFDRHLGPQWLDGTANRSLWQRVAEIPDNELWRSKERLRDRLVSFVRERVRRQLLRHGSPHVKILEAEGMLDPEVLTIGFARRFATYKRANLLLRDVERLKRLLLDRERPVQLVMAGKAHPHDHPGKEIIRQIAQLARGAEFQHRILFLEDYDLDVAKVLVQGCDVWLNTPRRPMEASGTSGMKAALNGGLNLSILDGWWSEAFSGENGWAIGTGETLADQHHQDDLESQMLYDLLETEVVPLFYQRGPDGVPREWIARVKASLSTICPQFNTDRMVEEYVERLYVPAAVNASMLRRDDFQGARELAAWKDAIRVQWRDVSVLAATTDTSREIEIGAELPITVRVLLGSLSPDDVSVEVLHGPLDARGEILGGDAMPLTYQQSEGGVAVFQGGIPCRDAGRNGFAVRVLPFHRNLTNKFETGFVTWWSGSSLAPSEAVASRVG